MRTRLSTVTHEGFVSLLRHCGEENAPCADFWVARPQETEGPLLDLALL